MSSPIVEAEVGLESAVPRALEPAGFAVDCVTDAESGPCQALAVDSDPML
ncbi:MAG: hypothetical protein QGG14_04890 [Planctomycetota bacterium]|nr:hypothetical protein [Planctomycetota bacterium]